MWKEELSFLVGGVGCSCRTLYRLLDAIPDDVKQLIVSLAFDGTSATALLLDRRTGAVLQPPKLYNESQVSVQHAHPVHISLLML